MGRIAVKFALASVLAFATAWGWANAGYYHQLCRAGRLASQVDGYYARGQHAPRELLDQLSSMQDTIVARRSSNNRTEARDGAPTE